MLLILFIAVISLASSYLAGQLLVDYGNEVVSKLGEVYRWVFAASAVLIPGLIASLIISAVEFADWPFILVGFVIGIATAAGFVKEKLFIKCTTMYNLYQEQFFKDQTADGKPNLRIYSPGLKPIFPSEKLVLSLPISELEEFKGTVQLEPLDSIITLTYFGRIGVCFEHLQDLFYLNNGDVVKGRKKVVGLFESSMKRWLNNATSAKTKNEIRQGLTILSTNARAAIEPTLPAGFRIVSFTIDDIELSTGAKNAQETKLKSNAIHEAAMAILKVMPGMVEMVGTKEVLTKDGLAKYAETVESVQIATGIRVATTNEVRFTGLEGLDDETRSRMAAEQTPTTKGGK